jgi:copper chaperone CopZ
MSTSTAPVVTTYTVTGMTCGHCVASVGGEIRRLAGVTDVAVDLPTGAVTVTSEAPLDRAAVAAAVEEAGYELAGVLPVVQDAPAGGCCGGACHS